MNTYIQEKYGIDTMPAVNARLVFHATMESRIVKNISGVDNMMIDKKIELIETDITVLRVDAIVNAANSSLMGGGGVDGAIHRVAGPDLLEECSRLNGCKTGDAKFTRGYNLPAHFIIHTVGPVWHGGGNNEEELLARCYRKCMKIAAQQLIKSIAFPAVSTGIYRFPKDKAASIAIQEIRKGLIADSNMDKVILACFDKDTLHEYERVMSFRSGSK